MIGGEYWRTEGGNFSSLPQYFKDQGYLSIGMGKIYHPGAEAGNDDPISWSEDYWHAPNKKKYNSLDSSWWAVGERLVCYNDRYNGVRVMPLCGNHLCLKSFPK